jgi:YfiH family protein
MTADCLPVLFASADGRRVGAAHAGWRGLLEGVVENTVKALASPPETLTAWLGPAISQAAFEVGPEVRDAFVTADADAAAHFALNARGRYQADLYALARQRLAGAGVTAVYGGDLCTFGDPRRFFSYRRDGACGRMATVIAIQGPSD